MNVGHGFGTVLVVVLVVLGGCTSLQNSAAQDPMKCERDAKCDKKRNRNVDCTTQCVDDPACVERCEQVQQTNGGLGH